MGNYLDKIIAETSVRNRKILYTVIFNNFAALPELLHFHTIISSFNVTGLNLG